MREIKFRGKRISNGKWLYGDLMHDTVDGCYVFPIDCAALYKENAVLPETIGQFTGLKDKNGKKIFEGDIVKGTFYGYPIPFKNYVFEIGWQEDVAGYKANYFENVEVIGNIHDNSELIGGRDDE